MKQKIVAKVVCILTKANLRVGKACIRRQKRAQAFLAVPEA